MFEEGESNRGRKIRWKRVRLKKEENKVEESWIKEGGIVKKPKTSSLSKLLLLVVFVFFNAKKVAMNVLM